MRKLFIALAVLLSLNTFAQQRIWVDSDIMIGKFGKDVDDGLALIMLLQDPNLDIVGISLTQGVDYGMEVTQKLVNWYGRGKQIPIYKGKTEDSDFTSGPNDAVGALINALRKEELLLVVLGPATNVGIALQMEPELQNQVTGMIFCMGRRPGMVFNPGKGKKNLNDYNLDLEPASMKFLVEETDIPINLTGYEASTHVQISKDDLAPLKASKEDRHKFLYKAMNRWRRQWGWFLGEKRGFYPFDAVTIASLVAPEKTACNDNIPTAIQVLPNDSKYMVKTDTKPFLLVDYQLTTTRKVHYCHKVDDTYKGFILEMLLR